MGILLFILQLKIKYFEWSIKKFIKCSGSSVKPNLTCSKVMPKGSFKQRGILSYQKFLTWEHNQNRWSNDSSSFISGLKVNLEKSSLFPLGPYRHNIPHYFDNFAFQFRNETVTYLGISFTHHEDDFFKLNYVPKLSRI